MGSSENISSNGSSVVALMPEYYVEPNGVLVARLTIESLLALVGFFGNILVCVVIAKRMRAKTAINYYLFNLGIADTGVLLVVFPMAVLQEQVKDYFPLGREVCLYVYPAIDTFYGASIWLVTAVAIERYINIVKRFEVYHRSLKTSTYVIIAIWVISFVIVSLPLFFVMEYQEANSACFVNWFRTPSLLFWQQVYTVTLTFFTYVLPLSIISWTYIKIGGRLVQSSGFHREIERKNTQTRNGVGTDKKRKKKMENLRLKENKKAKKILTPIVVTFASTMFPINLFRLVAVYWPQVFYLKCFWILYNVLVIFTAANSAVNPVIYSIVSQEFRRGFAQLLFRGKRKPCSAMSLRSTTFQGRGYISFYPKNWPKAETLKETDL